MTTQIKVEDRLLPCFLTEEERKLKADDAAEKSALAGEKRKEEKIAKSTAKAAKEKAELLEREAGFLLSIYRRGKEDRNVPVRHEYHDQDKLVHEVRADTGETITKRPATAQEMQQRREKP